MGIGYGIGFFISVSDLFFIFPFQNIPKHIN